MNITVNAPKASVTNGMGLYDLLLGTEAFVNVRQNEDVTVSCTDGEVKGTVQSVQIGFLGQFLAGQPGAFVANVGRPADLRTVVDALEARQAKAADKAKAVDPRTLYTFVSVSVPYAAPTSVPMPVAA
ncbi:hypothetical protein [Methylobacterium sp. AMS5]|uniref:hypothetical protein n=1 Tax=Methylobacterium sp. AMS5 TaxID=925818 RepID=UPI00074F87E0|nr:hypothetical protein [Methylobacterium sp. AMS5]AMB48329.1 hypothetical protein Y590_25510 [Methylobacterium sp. AMS5]